MKFVFRWVSLALLVAGLFACGGGGGDFGSGDGDGGDGGDGGGVVVTVLLGTGSGAAFEASVITVSPTAIATGQTATLTVNVVDSVNFELVSDAQNIQFNSVCANEEPPRASISSPLALEPGVYRASYQALGCEGEDTIVATLDGVAAAQGTITITDPILGDVRLGTGTGPDFMDMQIDIEPSEIAADGASLLSVNSVDSETQELVVESQNVVFSSQCAGEDPPRAQIQPVLTVQAGVYEARYEAQGCLGDDVIVATLDDAVAATGTLRVLNPAVGTLQFVSTVPDRIALAGFGSDGFPEFSDVTFRVLDALGQPVANTLVTFELTHTLGGIGLVNTSDISNADGLVIARVRSGDINTTVRVLAAYQSDTGEIIQTVSGPIALNSGLADQNSFSISATVLNPFAFDFFYPLDSAPVDLTVFAADYFNNPVPDGTQITLVSENGGQVQGNCGTVNGACSVPWASSGDPPKAGESIPAYKDELTGQSVPKYFDPNKKGIVTIIARVVGEESFEADPNGNRLFDPEELAGVGQLAEAWLDENGDGHYQNDETYFDYNSDGLYTRENDVYEGAGCSLLARDAGHCAELIEARRSIRLVMSGDDLEIKTNQIALNLDPSVGPTGLCYTIEDENGNVPPNNTAISVSTNVGEIIDGETSYNIPNTFRPRPWGPKCVSLKGNGSGDFGSLRISATVPAPSNKVEVVSIDVVDPVIAPTPPSPPEITSAVYDGTDTIVVVGTAEPGASVEAGIVGQGLSETDTASGLGEWRIEIDASSLAAGSYQVVAIQTVDQVASANSSPEAVNIP